MIDAIFKIFVYKIKIQYRRYVFSIFWNSIYLLQIFAFKIHTWHFPLLSFFYITILYVYKLYYHLTIFISFGKNPEYIHLGAVPTNYAVQNNLFFLLYIILFFYLPEVAFILILVALLQKKIDGKVEIVIWCLTHQSNQNFIIICLRLNCRINIKISDRTIKVAIGTRAEPVWVLIKNHAIGRN